MRAFATLALSVVELSPLSKAALDLVSGVACPLETPSRALGVLPSTLLRIEDKYKQIKPVIFFLQTEKAAIAINGEKQF